VSKVITANRLADGRVVYLRALADWVEDIAAATAFDGAESEVRLTAAAKAAEAANVVINPYAIELAADDRGVRAAALRERIRAQGPTVPPFNR
jgi:hypothetical protein